MSVPRRIDIEAPVDPDPQQSRADTGRDTALWRCDPDSFRPVTVRVVSQEESGWEQAVPRLVSDRLDPEPLTDRREVPADPKGYACRRSINVRLQGPNSFLGRPSSHVQQAAG